MSAKAGRVSAPLYRKASSPIESGTVRPVLREFIKTPARFILRMLLSAGVLAFLLGLMLHFHVASYIYLAFTLTGSLAIYLWSRPTRGGMACTLVAGLIFNAVYDISEGGWNLIALPAFIGLGSLAILNLTAIWCGAAAAPARLDTLVAAVMLPLFQVLGGFCLAVTTVTNPTTYDRFLYAFDERLKISPGFLAGQLLDHSKILWHISYACYEGIPLAMALAFAIERSAPARRRFSAMWAFIVAAAGGFLLYNLYPAAGPVHIFGARFPYSPPPALSPPYRLVAVDAAPRNAMPSVHLTLALLIFWASRSWPRCFGLRARWLTGALLGITVLATLGFGEHYLVDLFVALPFALVARSVAAPGVPWRGLRSACVAGGTATVLGWIMYLRQPDPPAGTWAWVILAATGLASILLEWRLSRAASQVPALAPDQRPVNQGEYREPHLAPG